MSIFAPRLRASTTRRSELAWVGPVFVPVSRRDFLFSARPAAELCSVLDRPTVRPPDVGSPAARFGFQPAQRAPLTIVDNQPVHRLRPFPSFRNDRGRRAARKPLHMVRL